MTTDKTTVVEKQPINLADLIAKLATIIATGDTNAVLAAIGEIAKAKSEIAKAQSEALRKESEALAGERAKLAEKLTAMVIKMNPNLDAMLAKVKATGFSFYLPDETAVNHRVALKVPEVKAKRASGGGGGASGTSEKEYGMKLDEIYAKFKTPEDDQKMEAAKNAEANSNSKMWQVKQQVKKTAIAAGLLKPIS